MRSPPSARLSQRRLWRSLLKASDEELMKLSIRDLRLNLEGSLIESKVKELYHELETRGLRFRPSVYFGDEWFSPEGMLAIAVPFYLAHPRLMLLEQRQMLEVEGGDPRYFMKLIRHEAGHCFDHAYRFSNHPRWREVFGSPDQDYHPETYHPRPYSRSFVRNLDHWYAQSHPDEDFAETFAAWLDPSEDWRKAYARWPIALKKLSYVDELVRESRRKKVRAPSRGYLPCDARRMRTTLATYYAKRRKYQASEHPDFFDDELRSIFGESLKSFPGEGEEKCPDPNGSSGALFMRRHRESMIESVSRSTGERKYTVDSLFRRLLGRVQKLGLKVRAPETEVGIRLSSYVATLVTHYLFTGKFKRSL